VERDVKKEIEDLVREIFSYPEGDIELTQVHGGITNILYKVTANGNPPALIRIFGKAGNVLICRVSENLVFQELGRQGFGPRCIAQFDNGRLEEWFDGLRPVEPEEMMDPAIIKLTAEKLAVMHSLSVPGEEKQPKIWTELEEYLKVARGMTFNGPKEQEAFSAIDFDYLVGELDFCQTIMPSPKNGMGAELRAAANDIEKAGMDIAFAIGFCHKDLLGANCLIPEGVDAKESNVIKFVDFEYSSYDYISSDIANHFNAVPESYMIVRDCFDIAYFPSHETRRLFFESYIKDKEVSSEVIDMAVNLCLRFSLITELRWGLWAVVQAGHSDVDFNYVQYAQQRFKAYEHFKSIVRSSL